MLAAAPCCQRLISPSAPICSNYSHCRPRPATTNTVLSTYCWHFALQSVKVIKTDFRGGKAAVHMVNEVCVSAEG